jgi:hypothetical protein
MEDNETGSRQQEMQGKNSKKKFGRKQWYFWMQLLGNLIELKITKLANYYENDSHL